MSVNDAQRDAEARVHAFEEREAERAAHEEARARLEAERARQAADEQQADEVRRAVQVAREALGRDAANPIALATLAAAVLQRRFLP